MEKTKLAATIWESANKMRSNGLEASEYKDYILGLIFYKFLSDKMIKTLEDSFYTDDEIKNFVVKDLDEDTKKQLLNELGYLIDYDYLFSTWVERIDEFKLSWLTEGVSAFNDSFRGNEKYESNFKGIFEVFETGISKLGNDQASKSNAIKELIYLIKDIPTDGKTSYDVLGYIYEDLISKFAANAGKKAGEFYTPHEVSEVMSEIIANHLKDREEIEIYDPTSGSGSLLITIGKSIKKYSNIKNPSISYYAQEIKKNTYNLTRMNLLMRGIEHNKIQVRNGDTLKEDWPVIDKRHSTDVERRLRLDAVVSNPPYSLKWESENFKDDPRYTDYGLAPNSKADFAFLLHDLYHLKTDGIMAIVLPHGVLFRGNEEAKIRQKLIENQKIDAIIGLPADIFYGTSIPTIIMILKQDKKDKDVLIIDASKGFTKVEKQNVLRASDSKKIIDTYNNRLEIKKYSRRVSIDEIRENEYNLNISRYVDSSDKNETWDIYASVFGGIPKQELEELNQYWEAFPKLQDDLFNIKDNKYCFLKDEDIKESVTNNQGINDFKVKFNESLQNISHELDEILIQNLDTVQYETQEENITKLILGALKPYSIVDGYQAYQIFSETWKMIQNDFEIIRTEGKEQITALVDITKLSNKKTNGKQTEEIIGREGKILPLDLVKKTFFADQSNKLEQLNNDKEEAENNIKQFSEELNEDEIELISDIYDSEKNKIDFKKIDSTIKFLKHEKESEEFIDKLIQVNENNKIFSDSKKEILNLEKELKTLSEQKLQSLNNEEIKILLNKKWINSIIDNLNKLPQKIINTLVLDLTTLHEKYSETLLDINNEINKVEKELADMIDELQGDEYDIKGLQEFKSLLLGKK
ncbi:type I restriction-modification system subunit M [[Mycoplasma] gypis]|uniref:site-specific DNA-methyltransferase (adenine-specific) n=1 Tax=[Mycoplasma] gypis TaxID=92404 RepID=A0ABZ2RPB6_9BACT|nr:type I restriction-modification system subunit M [[Mycoplasma] gypis]MBN0919222.1 type I restriction-modification system subunit M [[Mycoplasma] gypis]